MVAAPLLAGNAAVDWLRSPAAVRARAHEMLALAEHERLPHFTYRPAALPATVDFVLDTMRTNYPTLEIPFHSRWRHFNVGGRDRWAEMAAGLTGAQRDEIARIRFDLAVVSVLLDAGAGPGWSYRSSDGTLFVRSEGLAVASFDAFRAGLFSSDSTAPWRADAAALGKLTADRLGDAMQVSASNPLVGLEGRAALLRRLGEVLSAHPELFGAAGRIGNLYDALSRIAVGGTLPAASVLHALLVGFGSIWPGRVTLAGVNLGDVWHHGSIRTDDATDRLVPFHKLSQWLAYSLIEPLEDAGVRVAGLDELTGLAEYRNGGLMIDSGLIVPRDPELAQRHLVPGDEPVVEWRALTIALLDRIADGARARLGLDATALPLARVLEGGTWSAGRRIARARRIDGGPPLTIDSDGTVF